MAEQLLAQEVADAFVKQYYTILDKSPENAHKFYQEVSLMGWPGADGVVVPVTTLSGINENIMSSDYKNCSVECKTVDAQVSFEGGVIVVVTGVLVGKDSLRKDFCQTFFLAKQEKGYFVLNDILRFFDGWRLINDAASSDDSIHDEAASPDAGASNIPCKPASSHTKVEVKNESVKESSNLMTSKDTFAKVVASSSSVASEEKVQSTVEPASDDKQDARKITYASMVAKETPIPSPKAATVSPKLNTQVVSAPTTKVSAPLVDGKVSASRGVISKVYTPPSNFAPELTSSNGGSTGAPSATKARGIYIGDLPHDITKQGVLEVVKRFGPVRRFSDSIQIRRHEDGFCCAFVEFESEDAARRAVQVHHIKIGEKQAYITAKKSSYSRGNDGRGKSPTSGGITNGNFRERENSGFTHNERHHYENQIGGPRRSRPSDQWIREERKGAL